jgi:hypothetical protein
VRVPRRRSKWTPPEYPYLQPALYFENKVIQASLRVCSKKGKKEKKNQKEQNAPSTNLLRVCVYTIHDICAKVYFMRYLQNAKERVLQGVIDFYSRLLKFGERHFLLCQVQNVFTGVVLLLGKPAGFQKHIPTVRFHSL